MYDFFLQFKKMNLKGIINSDSDDGKHCIQYSKVNYFSQLLSSKCVLRVTHIDCIFKQLGKLKLLGLLWIISNSRLLDINSLRQKSMYQLYKYGSIPSLDSDCLWNKYCNAYCLEFYRWILTEILHRGLPIVTYLPKSQEVLPSQKKTAALQCTYLDCRFI